MSQEQGLGQDHIIMSQDQGLGQDHIIVSQEQGLGQDHIIVSQEQGLEDQEEATYIQQITTVDGQTLQYMTGDNQVTDVDCRSGVSNWGQEVFNEVQETTLKIGYIFSPLKCAKKFTIQYFRIFNVP